MNTFFRASLLALYALAVAALVMPLPWGIGPLLQKVALITLAIHILELVLAQKHVRAYQGTLQVSVVLTLLFGLLHWLPIASAAKAANVAKQKNR